MKIILTFVLSAFAALMLITARAAVLPACPPQMMDEVMAMLADKTDDEKLAVLVSTLDEFLKGGGGYSRVFIDDATNAVVEEINGELLGETPDIFTPEYLEMLRATMLEDMVTDYIGKFNILELAAKTGRNVETRMNFGKGNTLTIATFSPEQVAEVMLKAAGGRPAMIYLMIMVIILIAGMFMETSSALIVLTPIFIPTIMNIGGNMIHFGLLVTIGLAIGMATPPVAIDLYVASAITGLPMERLTKPIIPMVLALAAVLFVLTYVPSLTTFLPALMGMK